jgi:hypothetical protein
MKIMSFAGKWMELEIIILSEISQTQKDKYHIFSHMQNLEFFLNLESRRSQQEEGVKQEKVTERRM